MFVVRSFENEGNCAQKGMRNSIERDNKKTFIEIAYKLFQNIPKPQLKNVSDSRISGFKDSASGQADPPKKKKGTGKGCTWGNATRVTGNPYWVLGWGEGVRPTRMHRHSGLGLPNPN